MVYKRRPYLGRRPKPQSVIDFERSRKQIERETAGSYNHDTYPDMSGYIGSTTVPLPICDYVDRSRVLRNGDMVHTTPYSVSCYTKKGTSLTGVLLSVTNEDGNSYTYKAWRQGSDPSATPWGGNTQTSKLRNTLETLSQNALLDKMRNEMVTWDILTEAAELKETVGSLRTAAKTLLRLGVAVRERDVKSIAVILNLKTRQQNLRRYHRDIFGVETYEALDRRTPFLVGDGLQNIWMNYRYSLMPIIYSMEDAMIALAGPQVAREYVFTSQVTLTDSWSLTSKESGVPFFGPFYSVLCDIITQSSATGSVRKKAYYRFTDSILDRLNPNTIISFVKTTWELVPYSWIADWALGFSDYLQRLELSSCLAEVSVNVTYKNRSAVTETLNNIRTDLPVGRRGDLSIIYAPGGSSSVATHFSFTRESGNVSVPSYNPSEVFFNWKRQLDSASLLWQKVASQSRVRCRVLPR